LVLLDLMMPEMDGWETMHHMRKMSKVPVIIISALGAKDDVVGGLKQGADDYIAKPFFNAEVVERVKAVLRRAGKPKEISRLVFPQVDLVIDLMTQEVIMNGKTIRLTPKEFSILSVLAKHSPAIVSYETIGDSVWGEDSAEVRRRTKYLVYLLRKKFSEISPEVNLILNFDRLGYKLLTED
jgi:DNA-binding response OmpR family regulator